MNEGQGELAQSARARLQDLYDKLEALFGRAKVIHGAAISCKPGCDACCRRSFSVTAIEAEVIAEALEAAPRGVREAIAARAGAVSACAALEPDGRCAVYAARPAICRTHGLAIRFAAPAGRARSLPVLDACPKNFEGQDLALLDPSTVLDQTTLSTVLGALDVARALEVGEQARPRVALSRVLAGR